MNASPLSVDLDSILLQTKGLWEELRGQNIFITGGTGFIGCWLLESFAWANDRLDLGAKATVLTRKLDGLCKKAPHLASHPSISYYLGDVRSFDFPQTKFSHIIHAATEVNNYANNSDPLSQLDVITQGTRHTLDFAVSCGASKFLLTSSGAVYGKAASEVTHIDEMSMSAPETSSVRSIYGEGKRLSELLCAIYAKQYGLETKIARCFSFAGAYLPLDSHLAISSFFRDRLKNQTIQVQNDSSTYRSYLYAGDLTAWLWTILFKGDSCYPYNVGSEEETTILNLAHLIAKLEAPILPIEVANIGESRKVDCYVPSTQRARKALGLQQMVSLEKTLKKSLSWYTKYY
jgi:nucleoside-diphosphate-sugar epimerase